MNYAMADYQVARSRMEELLRRADSTRHGRSEDEPEATASVHRLRSRPALPPCAEHHSAA